MLDYVASLIFSVLVFSSSGRSGCNTAVQSLLTEILIEQTNTWTVWIFLFIHSICLPGIPVLDGFWKPCSWDTGSFQNSHHLPFNLDQMLPNPGTYLITDPFMALLENVTIPRAHSALLPLSRAVVAFLSKHREKNLEEFSAFSLLHCPLLPIPTPIKLIPVGTRYRGSHHLPWPHCHLLNLHQQHLPSQHHCKKQKVRSIGQRWSFWAWEEMSCL